ncbi:MAG TPA: hypothetical protein VN701_01725 [Candidatus Paceibacterota bacterium]|nr:hypothetical protein [Candidatus Paceibacterota bacterium]
MSHANDDDPHLGQGRSLKLQQSQMTTLQYAFILLFLAVLAAFAYYAGASANWLPKPPPVDILGWIKNAAK